MRVKLPTRNATCLDVATGAPAGHLDRSVLEHTFAKVFLENSYKVEQTWEDPYDARSSKQGRGSINEGLRS